MTAIEERYRKVKALAERGATEGEKQAALEAMTRMEERHPALKLKSNIVGHMPYIIFNDIYVGGNFTSGSGTNNTVEITFAHE